VIIPFAKQTLFCMSGFSLCLEFQLTHLSNLTSESLATSFLYFFCSNTCLLRVSQFDYQDIHISVKMANFKQNKNHSNRYTPN